MPQVGNNQQRIARAARRFGMAAACVGALGFFGTGYCRHEARLAPTVPDVVRGYTDAVPFSGQTRYVGGLDGRICTISPPLVYSGLGMAFVIAVLHLLVFRRLP